MSSRLLQFIASGALFVVCGALSVAPAHAEQALWIEFREEGKHTTTIALTEEIARKLLTLDNHEFHFSNSEKHDLLTREMLLAVLDGNKDAVEVHDDEANVSARAYMDDLRVPGGATGGDRLVLETYKSGSRNFRIALPNVELECADDDGMVTACFGWKGLLPFLVKSGGAVYIDNQKDDTEVWIYLQ